MREAAMALAVAFAVAAVLTWPVRWLSFRIGAVAQPGGRRIHKEPTAQAGGLAIYVAFWGAFLALHGPLQAPWPAVFGGSLLLLAMCLADDIRGLSPWLRLIGQFVVASIAYSGGVAVHGVTSPLSLWGPYHYISLGWLSGPLTVLWIVAITNALNWLDGLDGLVAGVGTLASLTIMIGAGLVGLPPAAVAVGVPIAAGALGGACLGFLPFNFNPAKIFMGDTGAMFLGYMLACLAVLGPFKMATAVAILVPVLVLGVPIFDTVTGIIRRLAAGRSPLAPDRGHIHHRLLDRGLSVRQAVLLIYSLTAGLCVAALMLWSWRAQG